MSSDVYCEHRVTLPWCYYDKKQKKIMFRLLCPSDVKTAVLLWGDPYDWQETGKGYKEWRFSESELRRSFTGADRVAWNVEIELPQFRRLKYGFRLENETGVFYFSENGVEPYAADTINRTHNHFLYPFIHDVDAPNTPEWAEQTVWYQIFPDRFYRKENSGPASVQLEDWRNNRPNYRSFYGGNLAGIREKLPWLSDLGISGLYLTPIFRSPSNHKYNTEDYFAVDPLFGDLNELKALVSEAHGLNIRVMLDAVFNHAGETHPFWQDVLHNQDRSQYKDYFHIRRFPIRPPQALPFYKDMDFHAFAWFQRMPKWNTENPGTRKYLLDAAVYWIKECDIDGWRLDVANEVSFDFWKEFSRLTHSLKTDFYIVGEIWNDASAWINPGLFDAAMNYPLGSAVSDCFITKKISPEAFTRKLFSALTRYSELHNRVSFNLLDSHDTDRVLTRARGDKLALKNAFTMLFLFPGSPSIYYGTEIGMEGGGDPDCRRPMIWDENLQDRELFSFFQNLIKFRKQYLPVINGSKLHYQVENEVHQWCLYGGAGQLVAVYSEKATKFDAPGNCVFGPEPDLAQYQNGELPPYTLAVYNKKA
ncbi:MAG: glycoside hydrolase family 13 protein [Treponema sp.]|jgi:glycosidase|nr:glycoside hydrolase family 13 protein [Treponema sp.]